MPGRQRDLCLALVTMALLTVPAGGVLADGGGTDGGLTWSNDDSPAGGPVWGIGGNSQVLVVNTQFSGVLRSTDGGLNWASVDAGDVVEGFAMFHPHDPDVGFVGGFLDGLQRTTDGGLTWHEVIPHEPARRMAIHPDTGRIAATARIDNVNHLFISDDLGETWMQTDTPFSQFQSAYGLAFGATDQDIVAMSLSTLWVSHDAGTTWTETSDGGRDIVRADDGSGTLYRVGFSGMTKSTDGGETWQSITIPMPGTPHRLAARPGGGLFAAHNSGVWVTDDVQTWTNMGFGELAFAATDLLPDPDAPDAVFMADESVGVTRIAPDGQGGYFLEGRTNGFPPVHLNHVTGSADGSLLVAGGNLGLYKSVDGGATWTHTGAGVGLAGVDASAVSADGQAVYTGGQNAIFQPFVMASQDQGRTWTWTGLEGNDGIVLGLEVDPEDPQHAWAATWIELADSSVYETVDGGQTWQPLITLPSKIYDVAWHEPTETLLVGTDQGVVGIDEVTGLPVPRSVSTTPVRAVASAGGQAYASGLGLSVWKAETPGTVLVPWADTGGPVGDLAPDPTDGAELWAANQNGALTRCAPAGPVGPATCEDTTPPSDVNGVFVSADGATVFASSEQDGLWRAALP